MANPIERIRNFGDGTLARLTMAGSLVIGGATASLEHALINPDSVAAEDDVPAFRMPEAFTVGTKVMPWAVERQAETAQMSAVDTQCLKDILAEPTIMRQPTMYHAGIRTFTIPHHRGQTIRGHLAYAAACEPGSDLVRTSTGQIEMAAPDNPNEWDSQGPPHNPQYLGNQKGAAEISFAPIRWLPNYLFNQCVNGKFLGVRIELTNRVRDLQTKQVVAQQEYTIPVPVRGSCGAAERSIKIAKERQ